MYMSIILEQQETIEMLVVHNKHLIYLLSQYMAIELEEEKLKDILKKNKE